MGVDSGLGTFRGDKAYAFPNEKKFDYTELCNPKMFRDHPEVADAFWRDMCISFESHKPHAGYKILADLMASKPKGGFIFSTNIDGYWEGIFSEDQIIEIHGSTKYLQCMDPSHGKGKCYNSV
jgi:NAD-dependent SIR2 family protein deacetylase